MYPHVAHVFIDGGYLRAVGRDKGCAFPNPSALAKKIVASSSVQSWASNPTSHVNAFLGRTTFYDALPEDGAKVVIAAEPSSLAEALRRVADRYLEIPIPDDKNAWLPLAGFANRTAP